MVVMMEVMMEVLMVAIEGDIPVTRQFHDEQHSDECRPWSLLIADHFVKMRDQSEEVTAFLRSTIVQSEQGEIFDPASNRDCSNQCSSYHQPKVPDLEIEHTSYKIKIWQKWKWAIFFPLATKEETSSPTLEL